jgi:uncharacterized protein YqjF (DUF2071 family)
MLEVSIRTYVVGDRPGVLFLSLDTDSRPGRWAARRLFGIEYDLQPLSLLERDGWVDFRSPRFTARYRPYGDSFSAQPGTLDHFLHERPALFAPDGRRIETELEPWVLQHAEAEIHVNEMAPPGLSLGAQALLRYCDRQDVRFGATRRLERSSAIMPA